MAEKVCGTCEGTGWVLVAKEGKSVARRCRCFYERKAQALWDEARIPRRYQNCSLDNFKVLNDSHKDALKISRKFVSNYPAQEIGLLFLGPCGVGKTHLAVAIIRELIEKKSAACCFYDFRELIRDIQSSFTPDSSLSEAEILAPVFDAGVLVLDELGAKRPTAWVEETVFYIINQRYNRKKPTIFTSNYLDTDEDENRPNGFDKQKDDPLVSRIGYRLRSRLYEMCKVVNMQGEDFRKLVKQASYRF
jgi:DNA replication protein DnaC